MIKMIQTKGKIIGPQEKTVNKIGERGFSRLITNPASEEIVGAKTKEFENLKIQNVSDYLTSIKKGDGKKGYCPFVVGIERSNGYYIRRLESADTVFDIYREVVEEEKQGQSRNLEIGLSRVGITFATLYKTIELELVALLRAFEDLSPQKTGQMKGADFQTVIGYFASEEAKTQKGCKLIADTKENMRKAVLEMGLMISEMTPHHKIGGITGREELSALPLYNLEVPVVMVRRMHKEDRAFMRNEEDLKIHQRFFGK